MIFFDYLHTDDWGKDFEFVQDVGLYFQNFVKNTLLKRAMESCEKDYNDLYDVLKGNTSLMLSEISNAPAKAITEFLKKNKGEEKPLFKGAYVEESIYSADQLEILETLNILKRNLVKELLL